MKKLRMLVVVILCLFSAMAAAVGKAAADSDSGATLSIGVDTTTPYVQAQVLVTLRLRRRIGQYPATQFLLPHAPALHEEDAIVKLLKFHTERKIVKRKGSRYLVTKWRYAVFPQSPGAMIIGPLALNARAVAAHGYRRFRTFRSTSVHLQVRAIPQQFTGQHWLPAKSVHIYQGFNPDDTKLALGTPISRRLAMSFAGAQTGELPAFKGRSIPGMEIHDFAAQRSEQSTPEGLTATLEQHISLTPTRIGQLTVPAIAVPWWNTVEDREEVAHFPGYHLTVVAAASGWDAGAENGSRQARPGVGQPGAGWFSLWWIVLAVALAAALSGLLVMRAHEPALAQKFRRYLWRKRALRACGKDDAAHAARAVLHLAQAEAPAGSDCSLRQLAAGADEPLRSAMLQLNAAIYGAGGRTWNGDALARALRNTARLRMASSGCRVRQDKLPQLHPLVNDGSATPPHDAS